MERERGPSTLCSGSLNVVRRNASAMPKVLPCVHCMNPCKSLRLSKNRERAGEDLAHQVLT